MGITLPAEVGWGMTNIGSIELGICTLPDFQASHRLFEVLNAMSSNVPPRTIPSHKTQVMRLAEPQRRPHMLEVKPRGRVLGSGEASYVCNVNTPQPNSIGHFACTIRMAGDRDKEKMSRQYRPNLSELHPRHAKSLDPDP